MRGRSDPRVITMVVINCRNSKKEVLGRGTRLLSFDMTSTPSKANKLGGTYRNTDVKAMS
jgi:hypothetical protein